MTKVQYPRTGTFGMVCSSGSIASSVGMRILEAGGNAFDAAAAVGFALQVLMPDLGGELVTIFYSHADRAVRVLCGQGVAPRKATVEYFESLGLQTVPRSGLLPAVTPGAFDARMLLLRDYGILPLADVLEPAICYARRGYPLPPKQDVIVSGSSELCSSDGTMT